MYLQCSPAVLHLTYSSITAVAQPFLTYVLYTYQRVAEALHFPLTLHLFGPTRETSTASMEAANKRYTKKPLNRYS